MSATVYGYIRSEGDDRHEEDRVHDQLSGYAAAEGLGLSDVFVDRHMPPARLMRPGLTALLDAIRRTDGCTVLVASLDHLSSSVPVRQAIEAEITDAGGQLLELAASDTRPAAPRS